MLVVAQLQKTASGHRQTYTFVLIKPLEPVKGRPEAMSCLVQMRELLYHGLGCMIEKLPGLYDFPGAQSVFCSALTEHMHVMWPQHMKLLLRHIIIPLYKYCPREHR